MIHKIYTVFDRKATYCLPVFNVKSDADAIRQFASIVVSSDTDVSKYPADFDLMAVAHLDIQTGQVQPIYPPELIINGLVSLQNTQTERKRYKAVLDQQIDIEEFTETAEAS